MARVQFGRVFRYLDRLVGRGGIGDETDELLLERFALRHEESAFAALVQRHGPMVLGVCQRVLNDAHDAEDAFQATFLVLARKSALIRKRESLDSWLHGVAYRVAMNARAAAARRRARERQAAKMALANPTAALFWQELHPVLDEELNRLPDKYRIPIVLCYLNGKTNQQAALQLGWTKGTVSGRLARARELLRGRLMRRGVVLPAGLLTVLLVQNTASAMPASLAASTVQAAIIFTGRKAAVAAISQQAVALAQQALGEMGRGWLKIAAAVLLVLLLGAGASAVACRHLSEVWSDLVNGGKPVFRRPNDSPNQCGWQMQVSVERLDGPVYCVAFAPDDWLLASGGADREVKLWDPDRDGQPIIFRGHEGAVRALAFGPGNRLLASGSADQTVRLWDLASRTERAVLTAPAGEVFAVAFAPDGRTVASGGADHVIRLWDVASASERATLRGHSGPIHALAFSRDGKSLVSGSEDQSVKIWDMPTGRARATLTGHSAEVWSVAISTDGKTVASGSEDWTVRTWDLATGQPRAVLQGHEGPVRSVAFTYNSATLVSGSRDRTIRLWRLASGQERITLAVHADGVNAVTCARASSVLASGGQDRSITIWRQGQPNDGP